MAERTTLFATVILPLPLPKEFTYRVPYEMNEYITSGVRVVVPFGKSKLYTGIVTGLSEIGPTEYQAKYIEHVLDETPIITKEQYQFWKWMSSYYMSPIGDVMNAAIPANFKLASESKFVVHPDFEIALQTLDQRESLVFEALEERESLTLKEISEIIDLKTVYPFVKKMIDRRILIAIEELNDKYTPKTNSYIFLGKTILKTQELQQVVELLEQQKQKKKQLDLLLAVLTEGNYQDGILQNMVSKKSILNLGHSASALQNLVKSNVLEIHKVQISRLNQQKDAENQFKPLSIAQQKALDEIEASFKEHVCTLLHGVTGSGKTEIYVQLIQEQLDRGKQVLFLLPEIALTTQLIERLAYYFGDLVGVYHSKFNQNERVEIWQSVMDNNHDRFRIILGARSSIFLPFKDLGLIIIDEEHESSFKQYDPSPRYNARDAAIVLAHIHQSKVLLGSATPAIETYFNASNGKYGLVSLVERFGALQLPEVQCADVKKERRQKSMQSHFTMMLIEQMKETLQKGEQIILFQNRRGYTPLWQCEICNWSPKCKNCDVSLTYHKQTNTLKCHYCSYLTAPMGSCPSCGSNRLKMIGFGTEKIEDELSLFFPNAVIARLDLDSTRSKNAYSNIITDFENRRIDILIGTQMVTKGLDFDHVSLVGVLDADMLLNRPDFRAFERSFQLMSQVAGRSGRKSKRGKVIIQTGDPDHWILQHVQQHDFIGFYKNELIERKNYFYPPYYKIIDFTLKHKDEPILNVAAQEFVDSLREIFKERVIGPEFPIVRRIQNLYLKNIKLKIEREAPDKKIKERIGQLIDAFYSVPRNKSIRIVVDIDPA